MAVLGLDLGGTKLKGGIFTENADIIFKDERKLERRQGLSRNLSCICCGRPRALATTWMR